VNELIQRLRSRLVDRLHIAESGSGFRLIGMIRSYLQVHLRRCLMAVEAAHDEFYAGRGLIALMCVRSIYENVSVVCDFERQLQPLMASGDMQKIHEFVRSKAFATRKANLISHTGTEAVRATNLLTLVEKMTSLRDSYLDDYEHLSEIAHPNALGAVVYFQQLAGNDVAVFSDLGPEPDDDLKWVLVGGSILGFLEEAIARIESQLPGLSAKGAEAKPNKRTPPYA
jgi:hypothetical protein